MSGPGENAACGRRIAAREVYYRFVLVLEGEQDVLEAPTGGTGEELAALLERMEVGPETEREWEEQVHWERAGVVCAQCRAVVVRLIAPAPPAPRPH